MTAVTTPVVAVSLLALSQWPSAVLADGRLPLGVANSTQAAPEPREQRGKPWRSRCVCRVPSSCRPRGGTVCLAQRGQSPLRQ